MPLSDLGKPKTTENDFSHVYALKPALLCDLGLSETMRKIYSFQMNDRRSNVEWLNLKKKSIFFCVVCLKLLCKLK